MLAEVSVPVPCGIPKRTIRGHFEGPRMTEAIPILFEIGSVDFFLLVGWWSYSFTVLKQRKQNMNFQRGVGARSCGLMLQTTPRKLYSRGAFFLAAELDETWRN